MRQYISALMPDKSGILESETSAFRHLYNVLRVQPGDMIDVRLPDSSVAKMTISAVDAKRKKIIMQKCDVSLEESVVADVCLPEIWLFMFLPKPQKMELIVRQATECGVAKIVPVSGKYCQAGNIAAFNARSRGERFARIVHEAREQSGSAVVTQILPLVSVSEAAQMWAKVASENIESECATGLVLYERTDFTVPLHEAVACATKNGTVEQKQKFAVAVGCEGGIAPEEIDILRKSGFVPVHFATNILRCETAALYGIAALQTAITEGEIWHLKK